MAAAAPGRDGVAASLRRVGVLALSETRRTGGSLDRGTLALLVGMGLALAVVVPLVADAGFGFDRGIYRVALQDADALEPAVRAAPVFRVVGAADPLAALADGRVDLAVVGDRVHATDSDKGHAAVAALRQAAKDHTFHMLLDEPDQAAAFPLRVELVYEPQARPDRPGGTVPDPSSLPTRSGGTGGEAGGTTSGGAGGTPGSVTPSDASGFAFLPTERSVNTPETLAPPFPFRSLILAYVFLVPMNFVVQVYAGSAIAERLNRRGEALLASPARRWEIIVGKALPYFLLMMAVGAAIAVWLGAGWLTLVALVPLALVFLALEFVAAMFARSFRELTFLTVFASVLVTVYAFLPAVFSDVHPVALVSPITLVVMDLRGTWPGLGGVLYATLPLALFSLVLFVLGSALYREEDLFHQKPVHAKAVDSLARQVRGVGSGFRLSVMLIPAVLVVELLLVTFLFAWPVPVGLVGVLIAVAVVEEVFKGAPSWAAASRGAVPMRRIVLFGALTGAGFFVAEKGLLLVSLAGVTDVPAGAAVFGSVDSGLPWTAAAMLLVAPFALHVGTAGLSAWGARHGRGAFFACLGAAVLVHTVYNWLIVTRLGGAGF